MKKIYRLITVMALVALMCVPAKAHDDDLRHEVAISYGALPNSIWIDAITDVIPAAAGQQTDKNKWFGSLGVEYFYHTSPLLGLGAVATTSFSSEDVILNNKLTYYRTKTYVSLMPAVKLNWLRKNHWGLYSKVALGAIYARFADKDYDDKGVKGSKVDAVSAWDFNWQVSLIGFEAGSERIRAFTELGIGEQGVALGGIRCKF